MTMMSPSVRKHVCKAFSIDGPVNPCCLCHQSQEVAHVSYPYVSQHILLTKKASDGSDHISKSTTCMLWQPVCLHSVFVKWEQVHLESRHLPFHVQVVLDVGLVVVWVRELISCQWQALAYRTGMDMCEVGTVMVLLCIKETSSWVTSTNSCCFLFLHIAPF